MKNTFLKTLSLLGVSVMMALSASAQDQPKVKVNDNEVKIKGDNEKVKLQKQEDKYKGDGVKVKENENELKVKADGLKVKANDNEKKIKATVTPMHPTRTERVVVKEGETNVKTTEHVAPLPTERVTIERADPMPVEVQPVTVAKTTNEVKKTATHRRVAPKATSNRRVAARKSTAPKVIVRTKVVRDTVNVYVPGPTERVVQTQTEYLHDTVTVTRVDTVVRMQTNNTYSGYSVPRGDFKKVKLKKDKDGEVHMKRKE